MPEAVEVLKALVQGEMFSHKLSAAALFPSIYERAETEEQRCVSCNVFVCLCVGRWIDGRIRV